MDTDLFQIITLALLLANLVALLLVLSALSRIRDAVTTGGGSVASATSTPVETQAQATPTEQWAGGAESAAPEPTTVAAQTGSWQAAGAAAATTESASAGTSSLTGEPIGAGALTGADAQGAGAGGTGMADTYATTPAATSETAASGAPALGEMPEEQPFERDGRWWFKRGDELLVYDEGTGQWVPAPTAGTGASDTGPAAALSGISAGAAAPAEADSGFWKCPSCGAVNGSTADSCRMCFTSRP